MTNEKRLIDAWKLVIDLSKLNIHGEYDHEDVMAAIASQETVDAVEVVHGRWITHKEKIWGLWDRSFYECSNCGSRNPLYNFNYCPNCGAKMDGDGNA